MKASCISHVRRMVLLLILGLVFYGKAHASCTNTTFPMSYSQMVNATAVASSALAVGDRIPGTVYSYTFGGKCVGSGKNGTQKPGAQIVSCYFGSGTEVMPGVYSTGLAGVGIRLRNAKGQAMQNAAGMLCDTRGAGLGTLNADMSFGFTVTIELVKTGTIRSGALNQSQTYFGFGVYLEDAIAGSNVVNTSQGASYSSIGFNGNVNVREVACNLTFPSTVQMQPVRPDAIAGSSASGATNFTISQSCDSAVKVGLTFDAAPTTTVQSASNGTLNIFSPGVNGNASGVVLQLTDTNGAAVPLQSRIDKGSLAANTQATYPYYMQYRGTGAGVTPGKVASAMVFTFDYQ